MDLSKDNHNSDNGKEDEEIENKELLQDEEDEVKSENQVKNPIK